MRITTRDHVNARTSDGRVYSAGAGAVTDIDDADTGMVELMRELHRVGLVDIVEETPESEQTPEQTPPASSPDVEDPTAAPAKKATKAAASP